MEAMHGLRAFLGSSVNDVDLADILNTVIGQPTLTKTDRRTVASESWSDEAERRYQRIGFRTSIESWGTTSPVNAPQRSAGQSSRSGRAR